MILVDMGLEIFNELFLLKYQWFEVIIRRKFRLADSLRDYLPEVEIPAACSCCNFHRPLQIGIGRCGGAG